MSRLLDDFLLLSWLGFHSELSHESHQQVCLRELRWLGRFLSGEARLLLIDPDRVPLLLLGVVILYCSMSFGRHSVKDIMWHAPISVAIRVRMRLL